GNDGGVIDATGNGTVQAASLSNGSAGSITSGQALQASVAGLLDNGGGVLSAQSVAVQAAAFANAAGVVSGNALSFTVPRFDNSGGRITANALTLAVANLTNAHGLLTQLGTDTTRFDVSGMLDNSNGGLIQTNATDLTLAPASLDN
ncbi:hypothetical protein, partial [Burkholderia gladioli]